MYASTMSWLTFAWIKRTTSASAGEILGGSVGFVAGVATATLGLVAAAAGGLVVDALEMMMGAGVAGSGGSFLTTGTGDSANGAGATAGCAAGLALSGPSA